MWTPEQHYSYNCSMDNGTCGWIEQMKIFFFIESSIRYYLLHIINQRVNSPKAMIGVRPMYFIIEPNMIEQMALTTPKQIIT